MLEGFRRMLHTKPLVKGVPHIPGTVFYNDSSGRVNPLEVAVAQGFLDSCTEVYREPIVEHTRTEVQEAAAGKKSLTFKMAGESPAEQYLALQRIALYRWAASQDEKLELGGIKETWGKNGRVSLEVIIKYAKRKQKGLKEGMSAFEKMAANFREGDLAFDDADAKPNMECVVECFPNISDNPTKPIQIACKWKEKALKRGVDVTTIFEPHSSKCCMTTVPKGQRTMESLSGNVLDKERKEREDDHNIDR